MLETSFEMAFIMFTSFGIKNFRCFQDVTVQPLGRLNLFTGMNNSGKTALLEALFFHLGPTNPMLPVRVNFFRGFQEFRIAEKWKWLFLNLRTTESIELSSVTDDNKKQSLRIRLVDPKISPLSPIGLTVSSQDDGKGSMTTTLDARELNLEYKDDVGHTLMSRAFVSGGGIKFEQNTGKDFPLGIFLAAHNQTSKQDPTRFSNLEKVGRQEDILSALKIIEPRLKRLAVLIPEGEEPILGGDIGLGEIVPLPLMGSGICRLASLVLALADAKNGAVLVDEIENGLHHTVMQTVWKALLDAARRNNAQIFATTHSWECIRSAHEALSGEKPEEFRLHRLERIHDLIQVISYDPEALDSAMRAELEVR